MNGKLDFADLNECLKRGLGTLLYEGPEGRLVRPGRAEEPLRGPIMTDITDGKTLVEVLRRCGREKHFLFTVHSEDAARALVEELGMSGGEPCTQVVYDRTEPPEGIDTSHIRLLTEEYAPFCAAHYHPEDGDRTAEMCRKLRKGEMWGIFEGDTIAGFIGIHGEGSMGYLEVLPEYRRKGYAMALETFLIGEYLRRGWLPYGHVIKGNEASLAVQRRMGFTAAEAPAIWVWRDDE